MNNIDVTLFVIYLLTNLMNCLDSLKFFVVNLLVHCMHCADQNPYSLKFPDIKRSVFGNLLNICYTTK